MAAHQGHERGVLRLPAHLSVEGRYVCAAGRYRGLSACADGAHRVRPGGCDPDRDLSAADHELPQPDCYQGHPCHWPEHPYAPQRHGVRHPSRTGRERRQRWCLCGRSGRLHRHGQLPGRDEVWRRRQGRGHRSTQLHRVLPDRVRRLQGLCGYLPGFGQPAAGYL